MGRVSRYDPTAFIARRSGRVAERGGFENR